MRSCCADTDAIKLSERDAHDVGSFLSGHKVVQRQTEEVAVGHQEGADLFLQRHKPAGDTFKLFEILPFRCHSDDKHNHLLWKFQGDSKGVE